jgi:hypothetical protein
MNRKRTVMSAIIAIVLAAAPLAGAKADSAYIAFPPFWPLITIGAIIGTAAAAVGAPLTPCCYYRPPPCYCVPPAPVNYYPPPGYGAPGYYQPGYHPSR